MAIEDDVKAANTAFYTAFRDQDMAAMERLWALPVFANLSLCCIHPGQAPIFDRRGIIQSWEQIMKSSDSDSLNINSRNEHVLMYGQGLALVVCEEDIVGNTRAIERLTATNVFVYQNIGWKICHHHAGRRQ